MLHVLIKQRSATRSDFEEKYEYTRMNVLIVACVCIRIYFFKVKPVGKNKCIRYAK